MKSWNDSQSDLCSSDQEEEEEMIFGENEDDLEEMMDFSDLPTSLFACSVHEAVFEVPEQKVGTYPALPCIWWCVAWYMDLGEQSRRLPICKVCYRSMTSTESVHQPLDVAAAYSLYFMSINLALADVAQWIECQLANQKVVSSIPSQGTCLGCGPGPKLGVCERQPIDVPLTQ